MEFGIFHRYFPDLTTAQLDQLKSLGPLYTEWNARINVISRQDIGNLYERHVLHSLGIAKVTGFKPGSRILDAGTGGGFPGIPLAIAFPDVHFHLVDSTAKKLRVVGAIAEAIGLKNITTEHARLEEHWDQYDFVVSRAVASLSQMVSWTMKNVRKESKNIIPNGILYLKGGELLDSWTVGQLDNRSKFINFRIYPLNAYFSEPFFGTKSLVHLFYSDH